MEPSTYQIHELTIQIESIKYRFDCLQLLLTALRFSLKTLEHEIPIKCRRTVQTCLTKR